MNDSNMLNSTNNVLVHGKYGDYIFQGRIGKGGNGYVCEVEINYKQESKPLKNCNQYVIKVLSNKSATNEKRIERFRREILEVNKILQLEERIDVIPICDSYLENDKSQLYWYLMPKAPECRFDRLRSIEKLRKFTQLGDTLLKVHKHNVFHRDIKPSNILFYDGRCCLSDFGLVSDEMLEPITGDAEALGPIDIRPPEMDSPIDMFVGEIDYSKVDVYLFAKTLWMVLKGKKKGFRGEYQRSDFSIYLDRNDLQLGETIEPLHLALEGATRHENSERITLSEFLNYICLQISIFERKCDFSLVKSLKFQEMHNEAIEQIESDEVTFRTKEKILSSIRKMAGTSRLVFDDYEKELELGTVEDISLHDGLFEITVNSNILYGTINKKRRIMMNIKKVILPKNKVWQLYIGDFNHETIHGYAVYDIKDFLKSNEETVGLSGNYLFYINAK